MAIPVIVGAFALGIVGAVGAKIGTDHVYPWLITKYEDNKTKITAALADIRERRDIVDNMENI